jgi:hypothetical protein
MPYTRASIVALLFVIFSPVLLCGGCYVAYLAQCTTVHQTAHYTSLEFSGMSGKYWKASSVSPRTCSFFIEFPTGERYAVNEIPQEMRDKLVCEELSDGSTAVHSEHYDLELEFNQAGELTSFNLHRLGNEGFKFAPRHDGPYLEFDVPYDDLHAAFGKPSRIERVRKDVPILHGP